jgi:hypothetical protein
LVSPVSSPVSTASSPPVTPVTASHSTQSHLQFVFGRFTQDHFRVGRTRVWKAVLRDQFIVDRSQCFQAKKLLMGFLFPLEQWAPTSETTIDSETDSTNEQYQ